MAADHSGAKWLAMKVAGSRIGSRAKPPLLASKKEEQEALLWLDEIEGGRTEPGTTLLFELKKRRPEAFPELLLIATRMPAHNAGKQKQ
nr:hypothetical protein Iba_chr06cCG6020 [Ipomoea batatas]